MFGGGLQFGVVFFSCICFTPVDKTSRTTISVVSFIKVPEWLFSWFANIGHTGY